jgi:uncharacterized protein (DUF2147 family)
MSNRSNTRITGEKANTQTSRSKLRWRSIAAAMPLLAILFVLAGPPFAWAADATPSPLGTWATANDESHVKIEQCGGALCGTITWLKKPLGANGKPAIDSKNPDPNLRGRPLLGRPLLSGFEHSSNDANLWVSGRIYDPGDGRTYSCKLTVIDAETLNVRGYVGFSFLGKTQTWTRVDKP